MSRFFRGNYGSALGDTRTAANLIAQAGATQGQMYAEYGERFANWISDKPRIKSIIRKWMNSKIGE